MQYKTNIFISYLQNLSESFLHVKYSLVIKKYVQLGGLLGP